MTDAKMHERWTKRLRTLGWGDVKSARIWFVGIEEALGPKHIEDLDKCQADAFKPFAGCKGKATRIYVIMSKLILGLKNENWRIDWKAYRDARLFSVGSEAVQTNLYPLGKARLHKWDPNFTAWFGLSHRDYYDHMSDENNERFRFIRSWRDQAGDPVTICFGRSVWPAFRKCFQLNRNADKEADLCEFYISERIVLTPFFWAGGRSGMSDKRIAALIENMNGNGLNPFATV